MIIRYERKTEKNSWGGGRRGEMERASEWRGEMQFWRIEQVRPSGYYAREIPISVVSSNAITSMVPTLQKIVSVQEILFTEERQEYQSFTQRQPAQSSPSRNSNPSSPPVTPPHPLAIMHAEGVYQKALCRLLENGCAPVAADMEQRVKALQEKVRGNRFCPVPFPISSHISD